MWQKGAKQLKFMHKRAPNSIFGFVHIWKYFLAFITISRAWPISGINVFNCTKLTTVIYNLSAGIFSKFHGLGQEFRHPSSWKGEKGLQFMFEFSIQHATQLALFRITYTRERERERRTAERNYKSFAVQFEMKSEK